MENTNNSSSALDASIWLDFANICYKVDKTIGYLKVVSWTKMRAAANRIKLIGSHCKDADIKNYLFNSIYPSSLQSLPFAFGLLLALNFTGIVAFKALDQADWIRSVKMTLLGSVPTWILFIVARKYSLRVILAYTSWMHERRGRVSLMTKLWACLLKALKGGKPKLYSYQGSLPRLPVPGLKDTIQKYLSSVRSLYADEKYQRIEKMAEEFQGSIGKRLQKYLKLKSWWATNYVSDWWEEYVYLRGRSPIMVNSNFYGLDAMLDPQTSRQAARAASIVHCALRFRRSIETEEMKPRMINNMVPLCSSQYGRMFNTTRIPGVETDRLVHVRTSKHIVVLHKGCYYKMYIEQNGNLLSPPQIEIMMQQILDSSETPANGERHLAALTAGDRIPWAQARKTHFSKGVNKASLDAIERAAFMVVLDEDPQDIDQDDPGKLDAFGSSMLHGKGYDRWFDKSFNFVITSNARVGFNTEHSWADAPSMGHLWEYVITEDFLIGYKDDGHTKGTCEFLPPYPIKLQWEIPQECEVIIESSLMTATELAKDADMHIFRHDGYGKGFIKSCKISPDAYIQIALQLAYYRETGRFCLTYEASMARLFQDGRTETIRSCSIESSDFARGMDDATSSREQRIQLLKKAAEKHQKTCCDAMTGKGVDRHLFCLYVVSKYLEVESPFLKEALAEPWRLSTSQTPHHQLDYDLSRYPDLISAGGGFGPVSDDGYGISYIIAGEDNIFFHISSRRSCPKTDSKNFGTRIGKALSDIRRLFDGSI